MVLRRPRLAVRRPYSNFWGTPEANPVFWKPCFLIGEQRNRPRGALIVRQTRPFVRGRARLRNLRSKFKSGRCKRVCYNFRSSGLPTAGGEIEDRHQLAAQDSVAFAPLIARSYHHLADE